MGLGGWSFPGTGKGLAVPDRGPPAGTLPLPKPREHSPPFVGSAVPSEGLVLLSPSSPEPPRTPAQAVRPRVPVFPAAAGPRRQPHEALGVHAGATAPPRGPAVQRRPGPRPRRPGRRAPPPPLPPPQGQEAEVPGEGAQPVRGHGWRCVRAPLVAVARLGVPEPLGTLSPPAPRDPPPAPTGGQRAPRPRRRTTHPAALPRALCWSGRSVSRLAGRDLRSPGPAPHSAGPGPPPAEGPAGGRRERRQERGRSQERRQPSSSSSEKQRFYSCDRFGGREPPHPRPSLSSHPTSPTAGQEPGPLRQVGRWAPGAPARPRPSAWRRCSGLLTLPRLWRAGRWPPSPSLAIPDRPPGPPRGQPSSPPAPPAALGWPCPCGPGLGLPVLPPCPPRVAARQTGAPCCQHPVLAPLAVAGGGSSPRPH